MRRRSFLTLLGGAAAPSVLWPLAAPAQQAMPTIGYLHLSSPEVNAGVVAFRKGLNEAGYVDGRNVTIEYRFAHNEPDRLRELAGDLVRRRVAVIATPGSADAALAAKAATTTIPIVFATAADPVQLGLVASLLVNPNQATTEPFIREVEAAAASFGVQIEVLSARDNREISTAFASLAQKRVDALLVGAGLLFISSRVQLATLATRHAVPAIYTRRENVEAGGLMSYGSNVADQFRQAGIYTARILKGEKPADLPVVQPTRFEFLINLQTAEALGITVPRGLRAFADEMIK